MRAPKPIRLSAACGDPLTPLATFIGRYCDFTFDGEELDRRLIHTADESEGLVVLLSVKEKSEDGKTLRWEWDRWKDQPAQEEQRGKVEIRLRDDAPQEVAWAYHDLRHGLGWSAVAAHKDAYYARLEAEDDARIQEERER